MKSMPHTHKYKKLLQGTILGFIFGFLLQKGGVAKYQVLEGQLLLTDFTVVKVMLSAILVAMIGIFVLHKNKKIQLHVKPTKIGANVLGGLIFGVGFAFAGYCPGTGAAALGEGSISALIFMTGLVAGSYLFAEASGLLKNTIEAWGDKGKVTLDTLLRVNKGLFVAFFSTALFAVLFFLRNF